MGSQSRGSPPPPGPAAPSPAAALPAPTGATGLTLAATASSALVCQGGKALLVDKAWPLISTINLCDVYGYLRGDGARLQLLLVWLAKSPFYFTWVRARTQNCSHAIGTFIVGSGTRLSPSGLPGDSAGVDAALTS